MNTASNYSPTPFAIRHSVLSAAPREEPVTKVLLADLIVERNRLYVARLPSPRCADGDGYFGISHRGWRLHRASNDILREKRSPVVGGGGCVGETGSG